MLRIVLDLDATDDPVHGDQLGKFFHGRTWCWMINRNPRRRTSCGANGPDIWQRAQSERKHFRAFPG